MTPAAPRVAVVTPFSGESAQVLARCLDSVESQTQECWHILVSDGDEREVCSRAGRERVKLARRHEDNGNTARGVGSLIAEAGGVDAIAYLDADNWFQPDHIEHMWRLHSQTGAAVCSATRTIHDLSGQLLFVDRSESDGCHHVDTSCLFLTRAAFAVLRVWHRMPRELSPLCDRVLWHAIRRRKARSAHSTVPTVAFRSRYAVHYIAAGMAPPPLTIRNEDSTDPARRWWASLSERDRLAVEERLDG